MAEDIIFPDATRWYVRLLRFANLLDDERNCVSWTKVHLLGSNVATGGATFGMIGAWFAGHETLFRHVWDVLPAVGTYSAHAHATYLADKRQRNQTRIDTLKASK